MESESERLARYGAAAAFFEPLERELIMNALLEAAAGNRDADRGDAGRPMPEGARRVHEQLRRDAEAMDRIAEAFGRSVGIDTREPGHGLPRR